MSTPHVEHHHDNSHALGENATLREPISADGTPEIGKTYTVPARNGRAVRVKSGQTIRITNTHGTQVCDTWIFNADHLDENIAYWIDRHPYIRHFVWNNLDPSMGRAEVNQDQYTPRLADFELSLHRALTSWDSHPVTTV